MDFDASEEKKNLRDLIQKRVASEKQPVDHLSEDIALAKDYIMKLEMQDIRAEELIRSGVFDNLKWLEQHIDLEVEDGRKAHEDQIEHIGDALECMMKYDKKTLARFFTKNDEIGKLTINLRDFHESDTVGCAVPSANLLELNNQLFGISNNPKLKMADNRMVAHELTHAGDINMPGLNARQQALMGGVCQEVAARLASRSLYLNDLFAQAKVAKTADDAMKMIADAALIVPDVLTTILTQNWGNQEIFEWIKDVLMNEDLKADMRAAFDVHLTKEGYRAQMQRQALIGETEGGRGNPYVVEAYVENMCERFGIKGDTKKNFVQDVLQYANGEKEMPLMKGIFTKDGHLDVSESVANEMRKNRSFRDEVFDNWDNRKSVIAKHVKLSQRTHESEK